MLAVRAERTMPVESGDQAYYRFAGFIVRRAPFLLTQLLAQSLWSPVRRHDPVDLPHPLDRGLRLLQLPYDFLRRLADSGPAIPMPVLDGGDDGVGTVLVVEVVADRVNDRLDQGVIPVGSALAHAAPSRLLPAQTPKHTGQ